MPVGQRFYSILNIKMDNLFSIDLSSIYAGLGHQFANFNVIICYCYLNNLKLVKPMFNLTGIHNNGRHVLNDLSKYYDIDNIFINGEPFPLYEKILKTDFTIKKKIYKYGLLRLSEPFCSMNKWFQIKCEYSKSVNDLARKIAEKMGNDYLCIHVRRGDRITNTRNDVDTQPSNIIELIKKQKKQNVYIMSNRIHELISLKEHRDHKIYFNTDFNILKTDDNYFLYAVECVIMNLASIRCSTFNTSKNADLKDYYHCYLTE